MKKGLYTFLMIILMLSSAIAMVPAFGSAQEKERVAYAIDQAVLAHSISTSVFAHKALLESDLRVALGDVKDLDYLLLKVALQPYEIPLLLNFYKNIMHKYDVQVTSNFESLYYQRLVSFVRSLRTASPGDKQKLCATLQILKDDHFLVMPLIKFSIKFMSIITHQTLSVSLKKQNINMILDDFNEECRAALPLHKGSGMVPLNTHIDHFNLGFRKHAVDDKMGQPEVWWRRWYRAVTSQKSLLGLNMVGALTTAAVSIVIVDAIQRFMNKSKDLTAKADDLMEKTGGGIANANGLITEGRGLIASAPKIIEDLKDSGFAIIAERVVTTVLDNPEKLKKLYHTVFDEEGCNKYIEKVRKDHIKYKGKDLTGDEIMELVKAYYRRVPQEVSEKILNNLAQQVIDLTKKDCPEGKAFKQFAFDMAKVIIDSLADKGVVQEDLRDYLKRPADSGATLTQKAVGYLGKKFLSGMFAENSKSKSEK